ncbi:MAG: hypothetical protein OXD45_07245 [Rhodobacteraceae bacterium]|nr:hypothetical protein [Paracoccaceae bacterium]
MNRTAQKYGKVPGPILPAGLEQVFQLPQDIGTAHTVAGNMRHPEAGLPAIMYGNAKCLEHDITTPPCQSRSVSETVCRQHAASGACPRSGDRFHPCG